MWVTDGRRVLVDGHNRYSICKRRGISFQVRERDFGSREDAIIWMIDNQLGKRNLTPEARTYLIGHEYNLLKSQRGGDRKSNRQNDGLIDIGEKLGNRFGVVARTVERAGTFTKAIDMIEKKLGPAAKQKILTGESKINQKDVPALARVAERKPEDVRAAIEGEKPVSRVLGTSRPYTAPAPKAILSPDAVISKSQAESAVFELGKRLIVSIDGGSYTQAGQVIGRLIQEAGGKKTVLAQAIAIAAFAWPQNATSYIRGAFNNLRRNVYDKGEGRGAAPAHGKYSDRLSD